MVRNKYENVKYDEYKYAFGDILLEDFDYDDGKNFRGVYGCIDDTCEKLFEEFDFYVLGDGTILSRGDFYKNYILFVHDVVVLGY